MTVRQNITLNIKANDKQKLCVRVCACVTSSSLFDAVAVCEFVMASLFSLLFPSARVVGEYYYHFT